MTSNSSPGTALVKVGGWSSHLVLDAADLVPVPDGVRAVDAETVVVNGITAWQMLHRRQSPVLELLGRLWLWSLLPNRRHAYFYNVWAGRALGRDAFRARLRTDLTAVLAAMAAGKLDRPGGRRAAADQRERGAAAGRVPDRRGQGGAQCRRLMVLLRIVTHTFG
jgi:hypothetical protein